MAAERESDCAKFALTARSRHQQYLDEQSYAIQ
jgi:hypothetical protein